MSRKNKVGLYYFSHDVDMSNDIKMKYLTAKHGITGYAIYNKLLEIIYGERGYFMHFDKRFAMLFFSDNKIEFETGMNIINDLLEENLFSIELYKTYQILTSARIQQNYITGTCRYMYIELIQEYLLVEPNDYQTKNTKREIRVIELGHKVAKTDKNKSAVTEEGNKFALWFKTLLPENQKVTNRDLQLWAECYDKLIKDKKDKKEIVQICQFARSDDFWQANFRTPLKLRKKSKEGIFYYDMLLDKMKGNKIHKTIEYKAEHLDDTTIERLKND